jgi:hypothetical protein
MLQEAVSKKLNTYELLSVRKYTDYLYKDKEKSSTTYKAYLLYGNLMTLLTKYDFLSKVREDSMIGGDNIRMYD